MLARTAVSGTRAQRGENVDCHRPALSLDGMRHQHAAGAPPTARRVRLSDGAVVCVWDWGVAAGDAPPQSQTQTQHGGRDCLFVHGNGMHARAYTRMIETLRAGGLHVYGLDVRGCGASSAAQPLDLRWPRLAVDVAEVHNALGLRNCVGVGHSLGGCLLLLAAVERPAAFQALYLYEPIVPPRAASEAERAAPLAMAAAAGKRRAEFPSRAAARDSYASKTMFSRFHPACLHDYVEHGFRESGKNGVVLQCAPATEAEIFLQGEDTGTDAKLSRVHPSTVVAVGGLDGPAGPPSWGVRVASSVQRGRLERYAALDHNGLLCDPDGIAVAALASFALVHAYPTPRL